MATRCITLLMTVGCSFSSVQATHTDMATTTTRSSQDLKIVAHQFPHLLFNAFMALNNENDKEERYQAFNNAVNNIVNIASLIRSASEVTGQDMDYMLNTLDTIFDEEMEDAKQSHGNKSYPRVTVDTEMMPEDERHATPTRNAHIVAHNFPHLVLNTFIALNNDNDRTERHLAFYNAINNIVNIASVIRSGQDATRENVYKILSILDTALGEDNIELRFYDIPENA